jgi:hypothetical protein
VYASGVLAQPVTPTQNIPDRYIVVFEDGVQRPAFYPHSHSFGADTEDLGGLMHRYAALVRCLVHAPMVLSMLLSHTR